MTLTDALPLLSCGGLSAPQLTGVKIVIAKQVLEGIDCLHKSGWVHRDIKPDNIMFDHHRSAQLMDFGLTHRIEQPTRSLRGTPDYSPPEMRPRINRSAKSMFVDALAHDRWAIGITLMELELGRAMTIEERSRSYMDYPFEAEDLSGLAQQFLHDSGDLRLTVDEALQQPLFESDENLRVRGQYASQTGCW